MKNTITKEEYLKKLEDFYKIIISTNPKITPKDAIIKAQKYVIEYILHSNKNIYIENNECITINNTTLLAKYSNSCNKCVLCTAKKYSPICEILVCEGMNRPDSKSIIFVIL